MSDLSHLRIRWRLHLEEWEPTTRQRGMNIYRSLRDDYGLDADRWQGEPADIIVLQYGFPDVDAALSTGAIVVADINDMLFAQGHPAEPDFRANVDRVHALTAGSARLEEHLRRRHDFVRYIPEGVDDWWFELKPRVTSGKHISIVWMGMHDNMMFFTEIDEALAELAAEHDITVLFVAPEHDGQGRSNRTKAEAKPYPAEFHAWSPTNLRVAAGIADIAVTPLYQNEWCFCKSHNKALSFMAGALPVVASLTPSYQEVIDHGGNGMLALHPEDWFNSLRLLCENAELRGEMGGRARETASLYTHRHMAELWKNLFEEIRPR